MVMSELFGSMVFSDRVMRERLPESTYEEFRDCCEHDRPLSLETANVIAGAMKDWAVEKGVTHFTHWFQPMTGLSAEKHDSFISPTSDGGVIMEFGGKELIKGEPDASSFPSGGLRATFEARGYTAWDPTSYAFIKDGTLCIPTAFCSYNGHALDKKTPLLRSMEAVSREGVKLLHLFGRKTEKLSSAVGPEQEYFLIDSKAFEKRRDLIYTGRTLFGARPPKGQELEDHYFGAIKPRVAAFMKDLDEELWKLGVLAKTKHNEVAPAQHELAPIYTTVNVATDQNQLTMEIMRKVAAKHGMTCLLHEKPFAGVNGSGKHNNWSLVTNFGHNIFEPGKSPADNAQFLLIVSLMIAAVDKHQDLLRISAASAGNDHRLGANEAPPAIVSMYLGDELTGILDAIADGRTYSKRAACQVEIGVHVLPKFAMDSTDRNRTSPLAFTGNKFEFRMLGSAFSIADTNTVLNTIMADEFRMAAEELAGAKDFNAAIKEIIRQAQRAPEPPHHGGLPRSARFPGKHRTLRASRRAHRGGDKEPQGHPHRKLQQTHHHRGQHHARHGGKGHPPRRHHLRKGAGGDRERACGDGDRVRSAEGHAEAARGALLRRGEGGQEPESRPRKGQERRGLDGVRQDLPRRDHPRHERAERGVRRDGDPHREKVLALPHLRRPALLRQLTRSPAALAAGFFRPRGRRQ